MVQSRRKVIGSNPDFAIRRLENSYCKPSSKWVPASNHGGIKQRKERAALRLSSVVLKIQLAPSPTALWL